MSRKFFKLAVERNKIKRRIKEIFRRGGLFSKSGVIIFVIFVNQKLFMSEKDHGYQII